MLLRSKMFAFIEFFRETQMFCEVFVCVFLAVHRQNSPVTYFCVVTHPLRSTVKCYWLCSMISTGSSPVTLSQRWSFMTIIKPL